MIKQLLQQLELSDKEIDVYLANLSLGTAKVSAIAKNAQVNRGTTYDIVRSLVHKGLIHYFQKGGLSYFTALEPEKLVGYAERKAKLWEDNSKEIMKNLPELKTLYRAGEEKPQIQYYEGKDGLVAMLEDTLAAKPKEILSYSSYNLLIKGMENYLESYWKRRTKLAISTRGIAPYSKELVKFSKERNKKELRKIRMIPPAKYKFTNEIDIYADRVAIMNLNPKNYMGVIIKNKDIAETQKAIFELAWAGTKALYKKEY